MIKIRVTGSMATGLAILLAMPTFAASYRIEEPTLNSGGRPAQSASYRLSLVSLGGDPDSRRMESLRFAVELGFPAAFRPPGEVSGLVWSDDQLLTWSPSGYRYNVYRDSGCWVIKYSRAAIYVFSRPLLDRLFPSGNKS